MSDPAITDLLHTQAITEVMFRYSRGLDRMDKELTRSVWHADGTGDYGNPRVTGDADFVIDGMWEAHSRYDRHCHQLTNRLIEVAGDRAVSETYAIIFLRQPPEDGRVRESVVRGRYLDRWSRRDGRWAIDHRQFVIDFAGSFDYPEATAVGSPLSARDTDDASFGLLQPGTAAMRA
jgi:hypothetical protein